MILKFVDPSHIAQLTQYLQALHDSSSATQNHTNLLLNCYSKLKKEDRIADLISKGGFEVESGIRICRTAGYFSQALLLAKSAQLHDWVISILFEDIHDPNQVLSYIAELDHESIGGAMKRYGGSLIRQLPKESTEVLIRLCSESYTFYPEDFIPFYVDLRTWCIEFLERVFSAQTIVRDDATVSSYTGDRDEQSRSAVTNTLFELYLQNYASQKSVSFVLNGSQLGSYLTEWARHIHLGEPNVSICLGIR